MGSNDKRLALIALGAALIVTGHKLMDAELGKLGVPQALGAVLVAAAMRA
jgi:hypothetical protein